MHKHNVKTTMSALAAKHAQRMHIGLQFFAEPPKGDRIAEIDKRLAEIRTAVDQPDADFDALEKEASDLSEERTGLLDKAERRTKLLQRIGTSEVPTREVRTFAPEVAPKAVNDPYGTPEYRSAFFKQLTDQELTAEERAAFTMNTTTNANLLPTTMLNNIWDLVSKKHVIMGDITVYRTGTVIELIKHTAITQGDAKTVSENAANDDENNTFAKVTLNGKDFSKHVNITYAMAKMSMTALESYLTTEIAGRIGEAMADDVITTIKGAVATGNKVTTASATEVTYKELVKAFGLLKRVSGVCVYVNYSTLYNQLVSMVDTTGRPLFQPSMQANAQGVLLGGTVKIEESMSDGDILIGDPKRVVYNMVQDIMMESDKDVLHHTYVYSGYARGSGALLDDQSFALVSLKAAG